jgi:hypothetical protein
LGAGALQAQLAPQAHFGPQLQGWHEHCWLEHLSVIFRLPLAFGDFRTLSVYEDLSTAEMS